MKVKRKSRLLSVIIGVVVAISIFSFIPNMNKHVYAANLVYEDFEYLIEDNDEITIIAYNGSETSVNIPKTIQGKTVTKIGSCAFEKMDIVNVTLPDTITQINYKAFSNCKKLETINFPDSLKEIGSYAFTTCHSLEEIELGNQIESIGECAFQLCISLSEITVPGTVKNVVDHALHGCHSVKELVFEEGVTSIEGKAALNMYSLEKVVIPKTVTEIGDYAVGYSVYHPNYTRLDDVTIYGYKGTAAEAYANKNGFDFVALDKEAFNPNVVLGDVKQSDWAYKYVKYVCENNYMKGKKTDQEGKILFDPSGTLTRAEFVQVLYNVEGNPPVTYKNQFSDVLRNQWYTDAVIWATKKGIVGGYGNGKFGVNDSITREQLSTMLYKYALYKGYKADATAKLDTYTDKNKISDWAVKYMQWIVGSGIMSGKGDHLDPQGKATRAECATLVNKFCTSYMK